MPKKISALVEHTTPISNDVLPIVDTSAGVTKKIKISSLPGLHEETPTGTVNGSNNVFSATHSPVYIVVDGVIRPNVAAIGDLGGNGFTVTGSGPYTVTVNSAAPPTSFIRSYYNI